MPSSEHRDIALSEIPLLSAKMYNDNLRALVQAENQTQYEQLRKAMGLTKPGIFSALSRALHFPHLLLPDMMHLCFLNYPCLLVELWRGTIKGGKADVRKYPFAVLADDNVWKEHGLEVERVWPFLPGFFDRAPCNIAAKWSSGYKSIEQQTYLYNYAPHMLRRLLPPEHWRHLCKSVCAVRNLWEYEIPQAHLVRSRKLLNEATMDFERIYYKRDPDQLHFVRPVIHTLWHLPDQVYLHGLLVVCTQQPMERIIGQLGPAGGETRQPSRPYANLSQRAARHVNVNAAQALMPSLDRAEVCAIRIPRGAELIGNDFLLLRALERSYSVARPVEARAFYDYFRRTNPGLIEGKNCSDFKYVLCRWARMCLPNGMVVRSAWKEQLKPLNCLRMARCVKVSHMSPRSYV